VAQSFRNNGEKGKGITLSPKESLKPARIITGGIGVNNPGESKWGIKLNVDLLVPRSVPNGELRPLFKPSGPL